MWTSESLPEKADTRVRPNQLPLFLSFPSVSPKHHNLTGLFRNCVSDESPMLNSRNSAALRSAMTIIIALVVLCLGIPSATAQHFLNEVPGRFTNATGATVRFRAQDGELRNSNPASNLVRNDGTIEFLGANNRFTGSAALGASEGFRVGGLVRYASTSATQAQQIQARWYSNLALGGSAAKFLPDGIYVGGESAATGAFTATGGQRFYSGTFFYDNAAVQTLLGGENYQNVEIARGREPKRIPQGTTTTTRGFFRQNPSNTAGLQVYGVLSIGTDGFFPTVPNGQGRVEIGTTAGVSAALSSPAQILIGTGRLSIGVQEMSLYAGSLATRTESASILIQTGATVRLFAPNPTTSGSLQLGFAGNELIVSGNLRNDLQSGTNTTFHPESTTRYNAESPQALMPTSTTNPYGNLILENADKTLQRLFPPQQAIVALAGNLSVQSSLVDVGSGELVMLTPSRDAVYRGRSEVQGSMRRVLGASTNAYTFNNAATRFTLASGPPPAAMTLAVLPRGEPSVYEAVRDVRRRVVWSWSGDGGVWTGALRLGYRSEEITAPFQAANESSLGIFALPNADVPLRPRRLATFGIGRGLATASALGFVEYRGLTNQTGTPFTFVSGDELLLRGGRERVQSVQNGRWSNPATWSTAREPDAEDSVEINHTVHIGFRRYGLDGSTPAGQVRESGAGTGSASPEILAKAVIIAPTPDTTRRAALLIGSFSRSDSTFADEMPPAQGSWNLASLTIRSAAPSPMLSIEPSRENLNRLRRETASAWSGFTIFAPSSGVDTTLVRLEHLQNSGIATNGARLDVSESLLSTGLIANSGTLRTFAANNTFAQDSIGSWVVFAGTIPERVQAAPMLTYSNLGFSGRSPKQAISEAARKCIVHDSLHTSREAVITIPSGMSVEARGGVSHDGVIINARRDALLRLNGSRRQFLNGTGKIDALSMENTQGATALSGSFLLQSALYLIRGEMQTSLSANLRLADTAVITRFPASSLAVQLIAQGRVRVRTRGDGIMTASGELLPVLSVLDVRNRGGYRLTGNVVVQDSLTLASRMWTEGADGAFALDFRPSDTSMNPAFAEDSAEIVGTVRRIIPRDTVFRLFNNRYTSLQYLPDGEAGTLSQTLQASFRALPQRFPAPDFDTNKVWRGLEIAVTDSNARAQTFTARVGYGWRTSPLDEAGALESPRILLQRWNAETRSWQTSGTPQRPTSRSAWNKASREGFWQYGVMDSVRFSPATSTFFALGVDSTRTLVPSAFFTVKAYLEGALEATGDMKTLLRESDLLPLSIDSTDLLVRSGALPSQIMSEKGFSRALPSATVDWLLLELRPVASSSIADSVRFFLPALLQRNGAAIGANRQSALLLELPESLERGGRFIATLYHRNHLPVHWRDTLEIAPQRRFVLDWSDTVRVLGGGAALRRFDLTGTNTSVFTLVAGDVSEGQERDAITRFDYDVDVSSVISSAWRNILREGYVRGDTDLDGLITTRDVNMIWNNRGKRRAK